MCTRFHDSYPRYDCDTPEDFKDVLSEYAHSVMSKGDKYNRDTCVLEQERTQLTENLQAVTEQDLQDPHIKFFVEHNPNWVKVHTPCYIHIRVFIIIILAIVFTHGAMSHASMSLEAFYYIPRSMLLHDLNLQFKVQCFLPTVHTQHTIVN